MADAPGADLVPVREFGPFDLLAELAHGLYLNGQYARAVRACHEGLVLVRAAGDATTARYLTYVGGIALNELGRGSEVVRQAQRLLTDVDPAAEPYWRAKGLALLAEGHISLGEMNRGMDALAEGAYLLEAAPSRAYNHMSASMAVALVLRAINLYEQADVLLMGCLYHQDAQLDLLVLQEAALLQICWGAGLDLQGEYAAARQHYLVAMTRALWMQELARACSDSVMAGVSRVYEGYVWERLGLQELAEQRIRAVSAVSQHREEMIESHLVHLALGRILAARGDYPAARGHLDLATRDAERAGRSLWASTALTALADADEADIGPHPAVDRWRALARDVLTQMWRDREARFAALRARMRVRELLEQTNRMGQAALEDPLTGLGNRRRLLAEIGAATRTQSVIFVDVDHFKHVNDSFSHVIGDRVLRRVAGILSGHCRADDVVVRYGGDEFVMLVGRDPAAAAAIADRMLHAVRTWPWEDLAPGLAVTISVGLATSSSAEEALRLSDGALYAAKRAGRDRVVIA